MLGLQQRAGNAAVSDLIAAEGRAPVVQRHSSFEHALLGDTKPARLVDAVEKKASRQHLLLEEVNRMAFFDRNGIIADPRQAYPQVQWHQLKGSKLWLSYGELNALGDYLPDPDAIDSLPLAQIGKVVSIMRHDIGDSAMNAVAPGLHGGGADVGMKALLSGAGLGGVGEVMDLERATKQLGVNSYQGLLSRNACHFAPFSWERWIQFHTEARQEALAHFQQAKGAQQASKNVSAEGEEHERKAWLKNGFGDHFLQDSFAAGHLVNKTLVMQWFNEYLGARSMTVTDQPDIAGQSLYTQGPTGKSHADNRGATSGITDPQSAQERGTREARMAGTGVVASGNRSAATNYQLYTGFLDQTHLQVSSRAVHDWFNQRGLVVQNGEQSLQFAVGGDDTLLTESGPQGVAVASIAAQSSQRAIRELLTRGQTEVTPEAIMALLPQWVVPKGQNPISLKDWNEGSLRDLCMKTIFPTVVAKWNSDASIAAALSPRSTAGGTSVDETASTKKFIELTGHQ